MRSSFKKCLHLKLLEVVPLWQGHLTERIPMDFIKRYRRLLPAIAGAAGILAVACIPCCLPLIAAIAASLLAPAAGWFGLTALSGSAQYGLLGAIAGAVLGVALLVLWRRRAAKSCACQSTCLREPCA
jgi:hypothetical protein